MYIFSIMWKGKVFRAETKKRYFIYAFTDKTTKSYYMKISPNPMKNH